MSFSRSRSFTYEIFEAGLLAKAMESIVGDTTQHIEIKDFQNLSDGGRAIHTLTSPSELYAICDMVGHFIYVLIRASSGNYQTIQIREGNGSIEVDVSADTPDDMRKMLDLLIKGLDLKEASDEVLAKKRGPSQKELSERLAVLERVVLGPNRTLRCFLSYRFTPENEDPARKLKDFLTLLGIDVVTGTTYEPRPVSQKVMERLKDDIDFVVLLIGQDGESLWTRDEIASAKHQTIPLIPIVEDGAGFSSGLFGDLEHVSYAKGHIGNSFFKVLEAVKYIRQQLKPITSPSPEVQ
jgi:hypothetical protein